MIPDIIYSANERKEPRLIEILFDTNLLITFEKTAKLQRRSKKKKKGYHYEPFAFAEQSCDISPHVGLKQNSISISWTLRASFTKIFHLLTVSLKLPQSEIAASRLYNTGRWQWKDKRAINFFVM